MFRRWRRQHMEHLAGSNPVLGQARTLGTDRTRAAPRTTTPRRADQGVVREVPGRKVPGQATRSSTVSRVGDDKIPPPTASATLDRFRGTRCGGGAAGFGTASISEVGLGLDEVENVRLSRPISRSGRRRVDNVRAAVQRRTPGVRCQQSVSRQGHTGRT
jgi:hypothetical protein